MAAEGRADAAYGGAQLCLADSLDGIWLQVCYIDHKLHFAILSTAQCLNYQVLPATQRLCNPTAVTQMHWHVIALTRAMRRVIACMTLQGHGVQAYMGNFTMMLFCLAARPWNRQISMQGKHSSFMQEPLAKQNKGNIKRYAPVDNGSARCALDNKSLCVYQLSDLVILL